MGKCVLQQQLLVLFIAKLYIFYHITTFIKTTHSQIYNFVIYNDREHSCALP